MHADKGSAGEEAGSGSSWPARPLLLAGLGLVAGLLAHALLSTARDPSDIGALQGALLAFVIGAAGLTGFTLERRHWQASLGFSLAAATLGGLVTWWNGSPGGWSASEGWRIISLLIAVGIAAPLFQAARDEGTRRFPYAAVHDHALTNVVLWGACWAFVAIVFALAWLLAMLFDLIKIAFLKELLQKDWFWRGLIGLAFGAALGLLRELDGVVRLLQRVVVAVLAVLAPVLAIGLLLFVLALPFTGLDALWEATSATTPILLSCVVGALILANAVIGNAPAEERRFPLLRYGAMGLGLVMLPLAVLAAIATGLRVGQYGFTPERLWAIVFVAMACLWGAAYLVALVRGRGEWAARVRPFNIVLAFVVCGVALLLAMPILSFNAISTRDQVARLESGKVTPDQFDWRALAFDFGAPGRAALKRLQASANADIRTRANEAAKAEVRSEVADRSREAADRQKVVANVRVLPQGAALPAGLRDLLAVTLQCVGGEKCTLFLASDREALLFRDTCFQPPRPSPQPGQTVHDCRGSTRYARVDNLWRQAILPPLQADAQQASADAYRRGQVEIRTVPRRQAFVGGVPVGDPFE